MNDLTTLSGGPASAPVDGFEVQAARWVGRGVRGAWSEFTDASKGDGLFRGFRSHTTGEYVAPSHGDVELPPGRAAVRVRAVNASGKGEWSMQQVIQLGDHEVRGVVSTRTAPHRTAPHCTGSSAFTRRRRLFVSSAGPPHHQCL